MFTTLYLVRHGQTVFNTRLLIQGSAVIPRSRIWAVSRPRCRGIVAG